MKLLADDIVIRSDTETIRLRPTLRAAMRLDRQFDGFDKLLVSMEEDNLSTLIQVLRETSDKPTDLEQFLLSMADKPIALRLAVIRKPLVSVVLAMIGYDPNAPEPKPTKAKPETFAQLHTRLFETATGVLGWTPEVAWNATPAEIIAASKGRVEFVTGILQAIFGKSDKEGSTYDPSNHELDREGMAAFKLFSASGGNVGV
jgi:hypothetical protein